ncbi:MAG: hypothetical protein GF421_13150 [Candidatus Aminicenantes bacterium]|nr:hypothetical protein [Candidatus Aminicenantes bacterium]
MKRMTLLVGIGLLIALNFYVYWSVHLYYKAENTTDRAKKVSLLHRSRQMVPLNDKVTYELGKVYFDRGVTEVANEAQRNENLERSLEHFIQSVRLNPGNYASHFRLAQALSYQNYFQQVQIDPIDQYKKAAVLTTFDEQIYFEMARILMQNWEDLSREDKEYAVDMMKNVIGVKKQQGLRDVIQVWGTYINDYSVMNEILPQNPESFRIYADYLGARSLSLTERLDKLARAETMEFSQAKQFFNRGQREARLYHMKTALNHLSSSLSRLERIKFYQELIKEKWIDEQEHTDIKKSVLLGLIKLKIQRTGTLKDAESHLKAYLGLEQEEIPTEELETYLEDRGLLEVKPGISEHVLRMYFKLIFDFKQHRYREVIRQSVQVENLFFSLTSEYREELVRMLQIVGDSYQRIDFVYDAGEFYQKALERDPRNIYTLLKMRENYVRLNDEDEITEIDRKLSDIVMPEEMIFDQIEIQKDKTFQIPLLFTEESTLSIDIEFEPQAIDPLVAVFFNGKVVDEQYSDEGWVSDLELPAKRGKNILELKPLNSDVRITKILKRQP